MSFNIIDAVCGLSGKMETTRAGTVVRLYGVHMLLGHIVVTTHTYSQQFDSKVTNTIGQCGKH